MPLPASDDNELMVRMVAMRAATLASGMTTERLSLITGMVIDMTLAIEPMITAHFEHLRMDTPEDEALRLQMLENLEIWSSALDLLRVHPLPERSPL